MQTFRSSRQSQSGAVLFIALIFLIMMSLLAVFAASSSIMQERMTGGLRNRQLGFLGAEGALADAERLIWTIDRTAIGSNPLPLCPLFNTGAVTDCVYLSEFGLLNAKVQEFRTKLSWLPPGTDGARAYTPVVTSLAGVYKSASLASQPRYIIEDLGPDVPPGAGKRTGCDATCQAENASVIGNNHFFRITARSQGGSSAVVRVSESVFSAANLPNIGFNPSGP